MPPKKKKGTKRKVMATPAVNHLYDIMRVVECVDASSKSGTKVIGVQSFGTDDDPNGCKLESLQSDLSRIIYGSQGLAKACAGLVQLYGEATQQEFIRFLCIKYWMRDSDHTLVSPTPLMDHVWHAALLETGMYQAIEARLGFKLHHSSSHADDSQAAKRNARLRNMRSAYRDLFGDDPIEEQPIAEEAEEDIPAGRKPRTWNCLQCNEELAEKETRYICHGCDDERICYCSHECRTAHHPVHMRSCQSAPASAASAAASPPKLKACTCSFCEKRIFSNDWHFLCVECNRSVVYCSEKCRDEHKDIHAPDCIPLPAAAASPAAKLTEAAASAVDLTSQTQAEVDFCGACNKYMQRMVHGYRCVKCHPNKSKWFCSSACYEPYFNEHQKHWTPPSAREPAAAAAAMKDDDSPPPYSESLPAAAAGGDEPAAKRARVETPKCPCGTLLESVPSIKTCECSFAKYCSDLCMAMDYAQHRVLCRRYLDTSTKLGKTKEALVDHMKKMKTSPFEARKDVQELNFMRSSIIELTNRQKLEREWIETGVYHVKKESTMKKEQVNLTKEPAAAIDPDEEIALFMKLEIGQTVTIYMRPSESIEELKKRTHAKGGSHPDSLRLICAGKQLEDGRTLKEYNIQKESTINCVARLRGC